MSARALYLHIPFCVHRCDYCDFFTRTGVAPGRRRSILRRMMLQLERINAEGQLHAPLASIYLGGGTPSALPENELAALLEALAPYAGRETEWTVELNPEQLETGLLDVLHGAGVNRLSLGVQSLDDRVLAHIGRGVDAQTTQRGLELLARRWTGRWTADLITAIPGADRRRACEDADRLLAYGPGHVSVYELGIEPHTRLGLRLRRGRLTRLREDEAIDQIDAVSRLLVARGFNAYEISSYALPGEESRHNLAYWRLDPWAAVGPGAVALLPGGMAAEHHHGPRTFGTYLQRDDFGVACEPLTTRELLEEFLMGGLRTARGCDRTAARRIFGHDLADLIPRTLTNWRPHLREDSPGYLALGTSGRRLLDAVLVDAFAELDEHAGILPERAHWPDRAAGKQSPDHANHDSTET